MQIHAWSWSCLLAMRIAATTAARKHQLARWLLLNALALDATPPWQPSVADVLHACRQAEALIAMRIALIPVWRFPPDLQRITPLPPALFVRGDPRLLQSRGIGIVGSRRASLDAVQWAYRYAKNHADDGTLTISGGAVGIDAAVHRAAIAAGAPTLAYLGSAIDRPYPFTNRSLFEEIIVGGGALVSEHPPMSSTFKSDYALRNRFIAAHARQLTVVEAAESSGTLSTASWARRAGTPVYVSPPGVGTNRAGLEMLVQHGWARTHEA